MKKEFIYIEMIVQLTLTILKPILFILSLLPFGFAILQINSNLPTTMKVLLISLSLVISPVILVLLIGLIIRFLPNIPSGKHNFFSKQHYNWLIKDFIYETIVTSAFLNNLVIRIKPIRYIFYTLVGMPNRSLIILANDVRILDPDKISIGELTFIGINTLISGHIVRSGKLMLQDVNIGNENIIGAFCSIISGVKTGEKCKIDSFVTLNNNVTIGNNSVVLGKSLIDSYVKIGNNVRVGKSCIIGSNTIIEDNAIIGDYLRIGSNKIIKKGEFVKTDML